MTVFRVIVAGSRDFTSYSFLKEKLDKILSSVKDEIEIISGTANGADVLGELYAKEKGYKLTRMPADWSQFGKSAGYKRNEDMAIYASSEGNGACVVFWVNKSKGTGHMINLAKKYNLKLRVIEL